MRREAWLGQLAAQRFDLLVIGGGIVGAGIARDAAMRGLKVALIEQGDFASGTSSKTSKLIHGGLRYLEHGHVRLVQESLRERHILRSIAPTFVRPLSLLLPVYDGDHHPRWQISLGLTLYDLLALGHNLRTHRMVSARRAHELEPALACAGLRGAGLYMDCQMDDARLCLANILQAASFGAVCGNYVRLRDLLTVEGRICGGVVEDVFTGRAIEIQAQVVVNATGPWADMVRRFSEAGAPPRIAPTQGVHLILPAIVQEALFVEGRRDRRMLFLLPWGDYTLVGTTETEVTGSLDALTASADDVGYLLEEVRRVVPGRHLDEEDIIATYAGARPLLAFAGSSTSASREHRIEVDARGLVSVMGGKYTTYRLIAQEAVDYLVRRHHWQVDRCLTDRVSLLEGMRPMASDHWETLLRSVDPDLFARLLNRYGAGALHVLRWLEVEPGLRQPICPHHEYIEAEIVYAMQREYACTLTDVLSRRTRVAWSSCQGLDALSRITALFQQYAGCRNDEIERQVAEYHGVLARSLAFRPHTTASRQWRGAHADR